MVRALRTPRDGGQDNPRPDFRPVRYPSADEQALSDLAARIKGFTQDIPFGFKRLGGGGMLTYRGTF